jgi:hypothetical protein
MQADFTRKLIRSGDTPVHYIVCNDRHGHIVHYFLRCTVQKLALLKQKTEGAIELESYGTVLASGFGHEPSEATTRMLLDQYNYDYKKLASCNHNS